MVCLLTKKNSIEAFLYGGEQANGIGRNPYKLKHPRVKKTSNKRYRTNNNRTAHGHHQRRY